MDLSEVSLDDDLQFETPMSRGAAHQDSSYYFGRQQTQHRQAWSRSSMGPLEEETRDQIPQLRHQSHGLHVMEESESNLPDEDSLSGGYSPPAWRRLENGSRSSGFWRGGAGGHHDLHGMRRLNDLRHMDSLGLDDEIDTGILEQAMRTRLPGSISPEKGRSPEPERSGEDDTLVDRIKLEHSPDLKNTDDSRGSMMRSMSPDAARDNCESPKGSAML